MPSGGGTVYQPTTVSYEPRSSAASGGLLGPASSIGVDSSLRVFRKPRPQVALLLFAIIAIFAGVAMVASGITSWLEATEEEKAISANVHPCVEFPIGIIVGGVLMACIGSIAIGVYVVVAEWPRNCICSCPMLNKKQARQLQSQSGGANGCGQGIMALNPSTDPLVSHTQYAPVSELPSLRLEDEERRNLMPDTKDCSADESDRMLEPDPRIVLRPICVEEQVEF